MPDISAIGIFCEDIREEKNGQITLVGILPDGLNVSGGEGTLMLAKLCLYVRVHVAPPDSDAGSVSARIIMPDGSELVKNEVKPERIRNARDKVLKSGAPILGLILRFAVSPLPIATPGRILAEVTVGQNKSICGSLAINVISPPVSPTAS